jgi:hypothetical protein
LLAFKLTHAGAIAPALHWQGQTNWRFCVVMANRDFFGFFSGFSVLVGGLLETACFLVSEPAFTQTKQSASRN